MEGTAGGVGSSLVVGAFDFRIMWLLQWLNLKSEELRLEAEVDRTIKARPSRATSATEEPHPQTVCPAGTKCSNSQAHGIFAFKR